MAQRIQHRRGTTSQWATVNPILATGEIGYDLELKRFKMGDGVTAWNSLAFIDDIVTADITDGSVTTVKVADANITTGKLADGSVTTAKVADANVTTAKIADLNVTTGKIADLAVTTGKITDGAVTDAKLDESVRSLLVAGSFSDDFNRPDGPIGNGWSDLAEFTPDDQDPSELLNGSVALASVSGTADQLYDAGSTTGWRGGIVRETHLSGGVEIRATWTGDALTATGGPLAFFVPWSDECGVGSWWNYVLRMWEFGLIGRRQHQYTYVDMNFGAIRSADDPVSWVMRSSNGADLALFIDTDGTEGGLELVGGPVMLPAALRHSTWHGVQQDYLDDDLTPTCMSAFSVAPWSGTLPTYETPAIDDDGTITKGTGTSVAADYGSGAAGDLLVALVAGGGGGTWSSSGWTAQAQSGVSAGAQVAVLTRTAPATGGATVTFTKAGGSSSTVSAVILRCSGVSAHVPLQAAHASTSPGSTTANGPSIAVLGQHRRSVWVCFAEADVDVTPPTGFTEVTQTSSGGAGCVLHVATRDWQGEHSTYGAFPAETGPTSFAATQTGEQDGSLASSAVSVVAHVMLQPEPTLASGPDWTPTATPTAADVGAADLAGDTFTGAVTVDLAGDGVVAIEPGIVGGASVTITQDGDSDASVGLGSILGQGAVSLGDGTGNQAYLIAAGDDVISTPGKLQQGVAASASTDLVRFGEAVVKALYDAHTILVATTDNTPVALTVDPSSVVGRAASGGIVALTPAQLRTIIDLTAQIAAAAVGGDLTGTVSNAQIAAGAIVNADINAAAQIDGTKVDAGTTTTRGTNELSTDAEAQALAATDVVLTPANLGAVLAGNVTIGGDLTVDDDLLTVQINQAKVTLDLDTDGSAAVNSYVGSEAQPRLTMGYLGAIGLPVLTFGPGGVTVPDTTFYRSGVAALTLVGTLEVNDATTATHAVNRRSGDARWLRTGTAALVNADVNASAAIAGTKIAAGTTSAQGAVELATTAEVQTGTSTSLVPSVSSMVAGGGQVLISESVLGADAASFDFTSIPTTFRHLFLEIYLRTTVSAATDTLLFAFNNDTTAANYDVQRVESRTGSVAGTESLGSSRSLGEINGNTASTSHFSTGRIDIPHYRAAGFKVAHYDFVRWNARTTGTMRRWQGTSGWVSTSVVSRVTLAPGTGPNFLAGSRVALYGIG